MEKNKGGDGMRILSVREHPNRAAEAAAYLSSKWTSMSRRMYEDCITHSLSAAAPLPQWYLLVDEGDDIVGCAGLITNDFISRMDLYPWLCGLYVEEAHRGHGYAGQLMERAKRDAGAGGFSHLYLCTDHVGYYERYGFTYVGMGYHPWDETSRIYGCAVGEDAQGAG